MAPAAAQAAMNASCVRGARHCNGSVRTCASVRWSASGNASGAGKEGTADTVIFLEGDPLRGGSESQEMSLPY